MNSAMSELNTKIYSVNESDFTESKQGANIKNVKSSMKEPLSGGHTINTSHIFLPDEFGATGPSRKQSTNKPKFNIQNQVYDIGNALSVMANKAKKAIMPTIIKRNRTVDTLLSDTELTFNYKKRRPARLNTGQLDTERNIEFDDTKNTLINKGKKEDTKSLTTNDFVNSVDLGDNTTKNRLIAPLGSKYTMRYVDRDSKNDQLDF